LFWDDANPNISQTVQRLADSWRNIIGSNGIMVLVTFFDNQPDLRDSDSDRQEFAKYYLKDLRFLYKNSQHDDKKVCDLKILSNYNNVEIPFRNGRGSFAVPSSSKSSLLTLPLSKVPRMFLISMTINQFLRWQVG
jgi:hypothetical protein